MKKHVNAETENTLPDYAIHDNEKICGFFGEFRFLSNFYNIDSSIKYMGSVFNSVEAAYQAAKYPIDQQSSFINISASMSKKLGRKANIDKDKWEKIKDYIMFYLVFYKFTNNEKLRNLLISTGNKYLEETNSWGDRYWGVCNGKGLNKLGKMLMTIRDVIKSEHCVS